MRDYAELVKALNEISDKTSCYYCHGESLDCKTAGCYISDAADAIEELQAAVPQWISVEERLPEINQSVLICAFGRSVGEGTYRGHDGVHHVWKMDAVAGTYWDDEITHWMPLPAPQKEVQDG